MWSWQCATTVPPYAEDASSWMVRISSVWYTEKGRACGKFVTQALYVLGCSAGDPHTFLMP